MSYAPQNGYHHTEYGIVTRAGSEYRLEVEVEGYDTAVSTAVMPAAPDVSASMDTDAAAMKKFSNVHCFWSMNEWNNGVGYYDDLYYPVSVRFAENDPNERKYFALEIYVNQDEYHDGVHQESSGGRRGIGVSELSKLQDNPDMEVHGLMIGSDPTDLYLFTMLLQSNLSFSKGNNVLNYYAEHAWMHNDCPDDPYYTDNPNFVKIISRYTYTLRVKRITTETFRYYRSLTLQNSGMGFFSEPVTIVGNIKNGYGGFSVFNSVSFKLMEGESCYYQNAGYPQKKKTAKKFMNKKHHF
jgi:hypothetical protein